MSKPTFTMMIGLVGSGKSTYAKQLAEETNAIICSSDAIREELYGYENSQDNNDEVFKILHSRIKENLKNGKNVIYDATNINSKRRRAFLSELRNIPCVKKCTIMATPFDDCCEQNNLRNRVVPYEVIERMYKNWNTPYWFEGWNEIEIKFPDDFEINNIADDFIKTHMNYDQDNPHHSMALGKHCQAVGKSLIDNKLLYYAGLLHDVGKPFCKMEKDIEIFKPVNNLEDIYEISNFGRVRNIKTNKFLTPRDNGKGYLDITLGTKDRKRRTYIHRLVAEHFIDIPDSLKGYEKLDVNHIDSNKGNNFYKNLEWCTRSQNQIHAFTTNPNRNVSGFDKWNSKFSLGEIESIKFIKEHTGYSNEKIGKMFNTDRSVISRIINSKSYITENNVFKHKIEPILPVNHAKYYQHHCVGAYDSLFFAYPDDVDRLDVSVLINLHMMPYFWEKDKEHGEKTRQKYQKLWGNELYNNVIKLHEADKNAH